MDETTGANVIIIDTNILIDWFHGLVPNIYEVLQHNDVAICGVVQSEFLCGARSEVEIAWMRELVDALTYIDVSRSDWEHIGNFSRTLREHGLAVPLADAIISYLAMKHNIEVWTRDNHFPQIQAIVPSLRLFDIAAGHSTT